MTDPSPPTDRRIVDAAALATLRFDERGLLPVVSQDEASGEVLMVAWANQEALERSLATGNLHFWSRSRQALWMKGETSGNTLTLGSLHADCDGDTVLARVTPAGPACHTGDRTCFGAEASPSGGPSATPSILDELWEVIEARDRERPEGSYTTRLLLDENLRVKKLGEETAEVIAALVGRSEDAPQEVADLLFHLLVALKGAGMSWRDANAALVERRK